MDLPDTVFLHINKNVFRISFSLEIFPDDEIAIKYISRCNDYIKNPPSEDWTGVIKLSQK